MNRTHRISQGHAWLAIVAMLAPGCALTNKADPLDVRTFTPEVAKASPTAGPAHAPDAGVTVPRLGLGRISAAAHLRKKIVYRSSTHELGIYEDLRWSERPEEYVRRAVTAALFDGGALAQDLSGQGPMLDLEVLAFEEVHARPTRLARIQIRYALHDVRSVLFDGTLSIEEPMRSNRPEDLTAAVSTALGRASEDLAGIVRARMGEASSNPPETAARTR